jgi:DNA-damage-inducible protein D
MSPPNPDPNPNSLVVFGAKSIRRAWHDNQWYFSVVDIVEALTDSPNPRDYWYRMKVRVAEESGFQLSTICRQLKLTSSDNKTYKTDCVNVKSAFRVIQSIPSPKAEPFKQWLAQVGYERVQEIENPELGQQRTRELYKAKGYPDDWIEKRLRSIAIRDELTDEWKTRGIQQQKDFAILTAEIAHAAFGITPSEHKEIKGLDRQNLRDHMTDLELLFSMLGEASTTEITRQRNTHGFHQNKTAAREGGKIAGDARRQLERKTGKPVVSPKNFLPAPPIKKLPSASDEDRNQP